MALFENIRLRVQGWSALLSGMLDGSNARYARGDLAAAPENPQEVLDSLRRAAGFIVAQPSESARERNFALVAPSLTAGLQSNRSAQDFYERTRFLQHRALPDWARGPVEQLVRESFLAFTPLLHLPTSNKSLREAVRGLTANTEKLVRGGEMDEELVTVLGLNSLCTYANFKSFESLAAKLPYRMLLDLTSSPEIAFDELRYFSPGNSGPLGSHAVRTLPSALRTLLTSRILSDTLESLDTRVPRGVFEMVVKDAPGPWQVFQSRAGRNLTTYLDWLTRVPDEYRPAEEVVLTLLPRLLRKKDPLPLLESTFGGAPREESIPVKDLVAEGLRGALETYQPSTKEPASVGKKLARIVRKSGAPYEEVVAALQGGKDPFDLMEELYVGFLRRSESVDASTSRSERTAAPATLDESGARENGVTIIVPEAVRKAARDLGRDAEHRFESRLMRIAAGNFGDSERLSGGVIEARIDSGPGYRIYLKRREDGYLVCRYGTKQTQEDDIRAARAIG